ncbi:MAG: CcmD family protein [Acidobacteriia bacterium]|nr:CcmD family protein [Terriglobia bacterium]
MNIFLFLAFSFVWLIFAAYAWSLSRRQKRLRKELEELKQKLQLGGQSSS